MTKNALVAFRTTVDLPDVDGALHNKYSLLTKAAYWRAIDVPQVAALRPPIKLDRARASTHFRPPEAEHARSYGTAASAAGKSCCAPCLKLGCQRQNKYRY